MPLSNRYAEIDGVIAYIHRHLYEPLPLSRLARYAGYSPFHFTRIFKQRFGLPPLYYVSSLRLQKAKDLLLRTSLSVRDISLEIGQQSQGTFTTRFVERVGVTPSEFRHSRLQAEENLKSLQSLGGWREWQPEAARIGTIEGTVRTEVPFQGVTLVGLFAKPIPEGLPLYGMLLHNMGDFRFTNVSPGSYYLMITSVSWGTQALDFLLPYATLRGRTDEPLVVTPHSPVPYQEITLHPPLLGDPPILISLPLLMNHFLSRIMYARK
ncbi:helix-turn-helix domain-containing protein [Paenibacillus sp. GCM10012306]|uniref:helix-turn-helix domain-containing protein n=1 Tax=Paenibacillus sp. GCM10012306 TaxID=3317342 RepID=UPI003618AB55